MKSKKHIWIMVFPILMSLMLIACGGDGEPQASVPDPSSTLSSADHGRIYIELASIEAPDRAQVEGWIAELEGAEADAGSEYSNAASGYSLSYPAGWYYEEDGM